MAPRQVRLCGGPTVQVGMPAADPLVLGVGGTLLDTTPGGAYLGEMASAHGSTPPFPPDLESASNVVDAATIIPSTGKDVRAATHPG